MCPISEHQVYGPKNTTSTLERHCRYNTDGGISILGGKSVFQTRFLGRKPVLYDIICNFQNSLMKL